MNRVDSRPPTILSSATRTVEVDDSLVEERLVDGWLQIRRGAEILISQSAEVVGRVAIAALQIRDSFPDGCSVALLGSGVCLLARLLPGQYRIDAYDNVPEFEHYAVDAGARFVLGDWRQTLSGQYDVIVNDTEGPLSDSDSATLAAASAPGGASIAL